MARRVTPKRRMPPGCNWTVTAELRDTAGSVVTRTVDIVWGAAWAKDTHHGHHGLAIQQAMNDALIRVGLPPGKGSL